MGNINFWQGAVLERLNEMVVFDECGPHLHSSGVAVCMQEVAIFPAVDAVEVVRCKDCCHYTRSPFGHPTIGWCHIMGSHKPQEWYCADGRKRK